jgi:RimJ/RimL family protein N-acetyltransferase
MQRINSIINELLSAMSALSGNVRLSNNQSMTGGLSDGSEIIIRPIRYEDSAALMDMHHRLSRKSLYYRYLGLSKPRQEEIDALCRMGGERGAVLIATMKDSPETIIGIAHYELDPDQGPGVAEPAILVEDRYQGKGLGSLLFHELIRLAQRRGVSEFRAVIHPDNNPSRSLLYKSRYPVEERPDYGVIHAKIDLKSRPQVAPPSAPSGVRAPSWFINTDWSAG